MLLIADFVSAAPSVLLRREGDQPILAYHRVELTVSLDKTYDNPFDPDEIAVDATITAPDGKTIRLPAFWDADGERGGVFRIRFCPTSAGRWTVSVAAKDAEGEARAEPVTIDVQPSPSPSSPDRRGFIRRVPDNPRYLMFDSGAAYFPVGLNLAWSNGEPVTPEKYEPWFAALERNGGNFARVWMCHGPVMLESPRSGLGRYDLRAAKYFDDLLDLADQHGIALMLTFMNHRELLDRDMWGPAGWPTSVYNAANKGPATRPVNFFTDAAARKLFKRRLRYLVARYSAYTNLMCWELFNEQELTRVPVSVDWNAEMSSYIRQLDPYGHLISNSAALPDDVWRLDNMSITQLHIYGTGDVVDLASPIVTSVRHHEQFDKPHLIAEFGISYKGPDTEFDPHNTATTLHNSLWAAAMSGAAGSAMNWWWDNYVAPRDLWHEYKGISTFAATVDWPRRHFQPVNLPMPTWPRREDEPERFEDLVLNSGMGWIKADGEPITVYPNGQASAALPHFFFGPDKQELRTRTTLLVETHADGELLLHVNKVSDHATLRVFIDDQPKADFQFSALPGAPDHEGEPRQVPEHPEIWQADINKDRKLALPAGKHKIDLDNLAGDWISLDRITIPAAESSRSADLNTLALQDESTGETIAWLYDAQSNWQSDRDGRPGRAIEDVTMTVPLKQQGATFEATWWDTRAGTVLRRDTVSPTAGTIALKTPKFLRDVAVRIAPAR